MLFFTRDAAPLFARWKALARVVDAVMDLMGPTGEPMIMPFNDQGSFAKAITEWDRAPFILPMNWNFRPERHRTFFWTDQDLARLPRPATGA